MIKIDLAGIKLEFAKAEFSLIKIDRTIKDNFDSNLTKSPTSENKIRQFLATMKALGRCSRRDLAILAAAAYSDKEDVSILDERIPIIIGSNAWIPESPVEITKENASAFTIFDDQAPAWQTGIFTPPSITLPDTSIDYAQHVQLAGRLVIDNPLYRLVSIEIVDNLPRLKCARGSYFDYMNTCEFLAFEWANVCLNQGRALLECIDAVREGDYGHFIQRIRRLFGDAKARSQCPLFSFENRCCGIGISTLLIIQKKDGGFKYWIHDRSARSKRIDTLPTAEGQDTFHVIPAGTFQQRHGGFHIEKLDFNIYINLLREFGEEFLGKTELENLQASEDNLLEHDEIALFHRAILDGSAKTFLLGVGLDPLTTKLEVLTTFVIKEEIFEQYLETFKHTHKFTRKQGRTEYEPPPGPEGRPMGRSYTPNWAEGWIKIDRILPAGAACLFLAARKIENILLK